MKNLIAWLTSILLFLLPFTSASFLFGGSTNAKYFLVTSFVSLVLIVASYGIYKGEVKVSIKGRWFLWTVLGLLAVYYLSSLAGVYVERSFWSDVRATGVIFLTYVTLLALVLGQIMDVKGWSYIRRSVAISSGIFGLLTVIGGQGLGLIDSFLWMEVEREGFTLGNSTYAGIYLVLALIISLIEFSYTKKGSWIRKIVGASIFSILASPILLNVSNVGDPGLIGDARASSVTAWSIVIFLIGWKFLKGKLGKWWIGLWLGGIAISIALLFTPASFVQDKYIETSTGARIILWESALEAIKDRPLVGYGPENFETAIERHFDNRLYLAENLGEIWFDRAHNVLIDILVNIGVIGLTLIVIVTSLYYRVIIKARRENLVSDWEEVLLGILPVAHFLQLQTGFDTVASYTLLGVLAGYTLHLERKLVNTESSIPHRKLVAIALLVAAIVASKFFIFDEYGRQVRLLSSFKVKDVELQETYTRESLDRTSNFALLKFSSATYVDKILDQTIKERDTEKALARLSIYEEYYKKYLEENAGSYRARMNYVYLLLLKTFLGENRVAEAKEVLRNSYDLSPTNPMAYNLNALASLYERNPAEAKAILAESIKLNPDIKFTNDILGYIEREEKLLPNYRFLRLGNL